MPQVSLLYERYSPEDIVAVQTQAFTLNTRGTDLGLTVEDKTVNVPKPYIPAVHVMKHQFQLYFDALNALVVLQPSEAVEDAINLYASIMDYYTRVLLHFCGEVKRSRTASGPKWRSAYLDFHFAMAFEKNSFAKAQQDVALKKLGRTWQHFEKKKPNSTIAQLSTNIIHDNCCNQGHNMCGGPLHHELSTQQMIDCILARATAANAIHTTIPTVSSTRNESQIHRTPPIDSKNVKGTSVASKKSTGSQPVLLVDDSDTDMSDGVGVQMTSQSDLLPRRLLRSNTNRDRSPLHSDQEDTRVQMTATSFEMKQDQKKTSKSKKSKKSTPPAMVAKPFTKRKVNLRRVGSDSDVSTDVNVIDTKATPEESRKERLKSKKSKPPAKVAKLSAKRKINSSVESDSDVDLGDLSENMNVIDIDSIPDMEDESEYEDVSLPPVLDNWKASIKAALKDGDSKHMLKLGAWMLLRTRQLSKLNMEGPVDGLVIPDTPMRKDFDDNDAYIEAIGMERMYAAIMDMDARPAYLAHLFHALGKCVVDGNAGKSNPRIRPLPSPPPVVQQMSDSDLDNWLVIACPENDDDVAGESDANDVDGSDALNDLNISTTLSSSNPAESDILTKRKRSMSNALSPPKTQGGRGGSKRVRESMNARRNISIPPMMHSSVMPTARAIAPATSGHSDHVSDAMMAIQISDPAVGTPILPESHSSTSSHIPDVVNTPAVVSHMLNLQVGDVEKEATPSDSVPNILMHTGTSECLSQLTAVGEVAEEATPSDSVPDIVMYAGTSECLSQPATPPNDGQEIWIQEMRIDGESQ